MDLEVRGKEGRGAEHGLENMALEGGEHGLVLPLIRYPTSMMGIWRRWGGGGGGGGGGQSMDHH